MILGLSSESSQYTTGLANGYTHGLHYVFSVAFYQRLTAALVSSLGSLTDAQVAPYADNAFEYDSQQRATQEVVQGGGDSSPFRKLSSSPS